MLPTKMAKILPKNDEPPHWPGQTGDFVEISEIGVSRLDPGHSLSDHGSDLPGD